MLGLLSGTELFAILRRLIGPSSSEVSTVAVKNLRPIAGGLILDISSVASWSDSSSDSSSDPSSDSSSVCETEIVVGRDVLLDLNVVRTKLGVAVSPPNSTLADFGFCWSRCINGSSSELA